MSSRSLTHYEVLGVSDTASAEEIKRAYRQLSLKFHPDRAEQGASRDFVCIQEAWETLREAATRNIYDQKLMECQILDHQNVTANVDLDDMQCIENDEYDEYVYPCRCGDQYRILSTDLERGVTNVQCEGCSLIVHILYDMVDEDDSS